ncbi:MAG: OsmC family protein [Rhodospirillales bacterium]
MTGPLVDDPALLEPVTLRIAGDCPGYALSRVRVRGHVVAIDEPPERGGTDEGPAPTETLVAALVGVSNVILRRIARRDGIAIRTLSVAAEAVLDRRGVWLAEAVGNPWREVRLVLTIDTDADDARLAVWTGELMRFSPVHALLTAAGTPVTMRWERAGG